MFLLHQIISGGQTGVDQTALEVAKELGIPTGGWAPKGWWTDTGVNFALRDVYGLQEHPHGYVGRTRANVQMADATIWFGKLSPGYFATWKAVAEFNRPWWSNPTSDVLRSFLQGVKILNVAGNRSSMHPEASEQCRRVLLEVLRDRA